jgi:O-methyltransferase involved in polyketide biosynthesis
MIHAEPLVVAIARENRSFLRRAVTFLAGAGIDQFLDLGSGVPTVGNVHEVAAAVNPDARCVYVDNEPVAVAHSQILLEREGVADRHAVLHGDLRDPADIWKRALDTGVLDPNRPIGLIMVGVLYFLARDEPVAATIRKYLSLLPSGSYFLSSHLTSDGMEDMADSASRESIMKQYDRSSTPIHLRTRAEFTAFFDGLELVEPGIVFLPEWHPEEMESKATKKLANDPAFVGHLCGLGRKP